MGAGQGQRDDGQMAVAHRLFLGDALTGVCMGEAPHSMRPHGGYGKGSLLRWWEERGTPRKTRMGKGASVSW